jgi:hypothetical protein
MLNGRYLNVHRLQRMLGTLPFRGASVFAAVASTISTTSRAAKWNRSSRKVPKGQPGEAEPLFLMSDGLPLPVLRDPDPRFLAHGLLRDHYQPRHAATPFRPEIRPVPSHVAAGSSGRWYSVPSNTSGPSWGRQNARRNHHWRQLPHSGASYSRRRSLASPGAACRLRSADGSSIRASRCFPSSSARWTT